jgi:ABC-2 type transport system permease protein
MVNLSSKKLGDLLMLANGLVLLVVLNLMAGEWFWRLDLTEEKRYTIKPATREMLGGLEDAVHIEVYLEGELNAGLKRLQRSVREILEEFRVYSGNRVQYTFSDPSQALSEKARNEFMMNLIDKGIRPTNIIEEKDGNRTERILFPGALVSYAGDEAGVMLLKGNPNASSEERINQSIEGLEYELASAIFKLAAEDRKRIGMIRGHGELDSLEIVGFTNALLEHYDVFNVALPRRRELEGYDAVVIAKPTKRFSEQDKYKIDQYIMNGGKVLWLVDMLGANMDSASSEANYAFPYDLNITDQLFKYGVRVNSDLVQDRTSGVYPIVTGFVGNQPQIRQLPWPFFPVIVHYSKHPMVRNLDGVITRFVSTIDTVKAEGIVKTPLLFTSPYTRVVKAPVKVSVADLRRTLTPESFGQSLVPVGWLLEGEFTSLYRNRFLPEGVLAERYQEKGQATKMLVIGDGDIARNEINLRTGQPQALGFDPFSQNTYANQDLLLNAMSYLLDEDGLITARAKEVKIRPLDRVKIARERRFWQVVNLAGPILLVLFFGLARYRLRQRKYARFPTE